MKTASASLIAFLDTATAGIIRHLITVTPRAGSVVRWTDHDRDLVSGGNTFYAGGDGTTHPVIMVGGHKEEIGLSVQSLRLMLYAGETALFNGTYLPAAALAGTLDDAWVKVERVFGESSIDLTMGTLHVFEGPVGNATPSDHAVELEVDSGTAKLRAPFPKIVFQPGCTANVYDAQCSLVRATFTVTGTVSSGATTTTIPTSRTEATGTTNTQGWFALGVITFTSGACNGESRGVRAYSSTGGTFTVDRPLPSAPANGDTFSVYPGCPKTLTACINNTASAGPQFNNKTHFRGFPFVPQNEAGY